MAFSFSQLFLKCVLTDVHIIAASGCALHIYRIPKEATLLFSAFVITSRNQLFHVKFGEGKMERLHMVEARQPETFYFSLKMNQSDLLKWGLEAVRENSRNIWYWNREGSNALALSAQSFIKKKGSSLLLREKCGSSLHEHSSPR